MPERILTWRELILLRNSVLLFFFAKWSREQRRSFMACLLYVWSKEIECLMNPLVALSAQRKADMCFGDVFLDDTHSTQRKMKKCMYTYVDLYQNIFLNTQCPHHTNQL